MWTASGVGLNKNYNMENQAQQTVERKDENRAKDRMRFGFNLNAELGEQLKPHIPNTRAKVNRKENEGN